MNIKEIIDHTRSDILYDTKLPYLWDDHELLRHLVTAYDELCRETKYLIDQTTVAVTRLPLLSNQTLHSLHAAIVYIFSARRLSDEYPFTIKTESYMDRSLFGWRATTGEPRIIIPDSQSRYISVYPKFNTTGYIAGSTDINFVVGAGPVYTITKVGTTFTSHYTAGDNIVVTGTSSNNRTFTLTNVAATTLTTSEATIAEAGTSAILQKVRDTALLRVARTIITRWVENDLALATPPSPEIDASYHSGLMHGIAKFAYLKQDTETYDPGQAKRHELLFENFKSLLKFELSDLTSDENILTPHYGMY